MADHGLIIPEASPISYDDDISSDIEEDSMEERNGALIETLPAMVSITRVPKSRPEMNPSGGKPLHVKGGPPPPLLRVGQPVSSLPPMPRLKLGGVRGTGPTRPVYPGHPLNGMMNMMPTSMSFSEGMMMNRHQMGQNIMTNASMGLPIITETMSLQGMRPGMQQNMRPGMPNGMRMGMRPGMHPALMQSMQQKMKHSMMMQKASMQQKPKPTIKQKSSFRPAGLPNRPVQVRTVFVPPPMNIKSQSGIQNGVTRVLNPFSVNPGSNGTGVTLTQVSNGKSGHSNGSVRDDALYEDLDIDDDDDDDGVNDDEDDEYNEITEAPSNTGSIVPIKNLLPEAPRISGSVTLHRLLGGKVKDEPAPGPLPGLASIKLPDTSRRNSVDSVGSSSTAASLDSLGHPKPATARKSFKPKSDSDQIKPTVNNLKRSVGSLESNESEGSVKKLKSDSIEDMISFNFGHHFMSELAPRDIEMAPVAKTKLEEEFEEKSVESLMLKTLCTCEAESIPVAGKDGLNCQAVEVVGGYRVGCKNKIVRSEIVKTSPELDPISLCDMHRDRLLTHSCCPLCGEFCSHGLVFMCRVSATSPPHLFHRFCYQNKPKEERCCPHCSSKKPPLAVQLKMTMSRTPLRILNHTSKMSVIKPMKDFEKWETNKKRESTVSYTLPSGKTITADGLPPGLETEKLEACLEELKNKSLVKHTTRNMYQPTAGGENVKLLQLLSLDYSPKQKFSEANGGTPLHVAASNNHVLTAHILVQAGAEVNALDDSNETPLMIACSIGNADVTRYLLAAGARVDLAGDDGMTALHFATQNGHLECAHVILSQNKLPRNFINVKDDGGWTPLVWACEHKHEAVIRYLVEQGADPFVKDVEMNISLHWASFSGSRGITDLLLAAGCNVNQANAIGETPLHIALRQDHYECALLLIARGARLDIPNSQGQLPSSCMSGENPKVETLIQLGTTLHKLMKERQQKFLTEKTVVQDISNGKEAIPVCAVNGEDLEMGPSGYTYVKNPVVTGNIPLNRDISSLQHCKCKNNCVSEDTCRCSDISTKSWYDQNGYLKDGFDYNEPPMIFECNEMCECNQNSCNNRVVQHGITARIQIYKTYGMGWGAKAMVDIPKGGFVCEYVGEIISDAEAEQRENDSYLFDLENREGETFCLDANKFGNVARFINHSCSPNLVPVKVFTNHQDLRFPHIALFASKPIKKGDVLGFDYGEKFWVIKHKFFTCWCGGDKCKYSKSSIGKTLESYYKKMETCKSPDEEQKQTGKLKLKLRMEEGKVVKVDDSGLLPDEPGVKEDRRSPKLEGKKSPKREDKEKGRKSPKFEEGKPCKQDREGKKSPKHEGRKSPKEDEIEKVYEDKKITQIEAEISKEDRKSPVITIKKSSFIEYKPKDEIKQVFAAEKSSKSKSLTEKPSKTDAIKTVLEKSFKNDAKPITDKPTKTDAKPANENTIIKTDAKPVTENPIKIDAKPVPEKTIEPKGKDPVPEPGPEGKKLKSRRVSTHSIESKIYKDLSNSKSDAKPVSTSKPEPTPSVEETNPPKPDTDEIQSKPEPDTVSMQSVDYDSAAGTPEPILEPLLEAEPVLTSSLTAPYSPADSTPVVKRGRGRPPKGTPKSGTSKPGTPKPGTPKPEVSYPGSPKPGTPTLETGLESLKSDSRPPTPGETGRPKRTRKSVV